jgi:hypothetical protein
VVAGHPDYFGKIEVSLAVPPSVINDSAAVVKGVERVAGSQPIFVRVPAQQMRNWPRYCSRYDACGYAVYFVKDDWYRNVYVASSKVNRSDVQKEARR